jgi:hypothetical protein
MTARVRVMHFTADPASRKTAPGELSSLPCLLSRLRASPGDPDKPLRLLVDDARGGAMIVKYGLADNPSRLSCVQDELCNLREVRAARTPHLVQLLWGGEHVEPHQPRASCVACVEYIPPLRAGLSTLRDLAAHAGTPQGDVEWRLALFQTLFSLAALQQAFPGFRHNDFKADNVMVTMPPPSIAAISYGVDARHCETLPAPLRVLRTWGAQRASVWAKLIDFELACTPDGARVRSRTVMRVTEADELARDYGLDALRCDAFDVHLLAFDVLRGSLGGHRSQAAFRAFVCAFIPERLMHPANLTPQFRLRTQDQRALQAALGPHVLLRMLAHPYFHHLRTPDARSADFMLPWR